MVVIFYLLFSVLSPASDFEQAKLRVLKKPKDAQAHLALSRVFKKNSDLERASQEVLVANLIAPQNEEVKEEISQITDLKTKPNQLQNDLNYWEKISLDNRGYRDAFLQKASLEYQLKDTVAAKADLQKGLELDPNYEVSLRFLKFLAENPF